jgi:RNA polymerase sigma factor (sigma-70 family)
MQNQTVNFIFILGCMNHLLELGLKTQSTSIIGKYLKGLTFSNDFFQSMFNYCVENKKDKALEFILDSHYGMNYEFLTKDRLSILHSICDVNVSLSKYKHLFNVIKTDISDGEDQSDEFNFDWESEDEPLVYKANDSDLKKTLKLQDTLLSSVTIISSESELLNTIDFILPVPVKKYNYWSNFIIKNKESLEEFYIQITFNDKFIKDDTSVILSLYFEGLDITELSQAINLSFFEMHSEHEIDFNNDFYSQFKFECYFISDAKNRFDEWLDNLDMFLEEWQNPKLSNPIFKYYFHMLGKPECQPLVKGEEVKLIYELQLLTYQLVNNELDIILNEIIDNFNDSYENPYILLSEAQQLEISSTPDIREFISSKIENKDLFLRPISISDYVRNFISNTSLKNIEEIKFLVNKFQVSNLRLVVNEANKYKRNYIEFYFDLIQEGTISLLAAINRFDPSKGHKFSTYATWWIKQSISRFVDINCSDVRAPIHYLGKLKQVNKIFRDDYFIPSKDTLTNSYLYDISKSVDFSYIEVHEMLGKALWVADVDVDNLLQYDMNDFNNDENKDLVSFLFNETQMSTKESEVIKKRFGINGIDSMTLEEVGLDFGLTRERIRQIESNALKKLRAKVNSTFNLSIDNSRTSTKDKAKSDKMLRDKVDA